MIEDVRKFTDEVAGKSDMGNKDLFDGIRGKKEICNNYEYLKLIPRYYGSQNKDKTIYYICEDSGDIGFFAMYRYWLEYLYFADVCGYYPVICTGNAFAYKEKECVVGTSNPFEYYFVQPAGVELEQVKRSSKVIGSDSLHRIIVELVFTGKFGNYKYTQNYLKAMGTMARKYLKFNDTTQKYICKGLKQLGFESERVLGVHIRGTDFKIGFNNHPVCVMAEDCFLVIDKILQEKQYHKIFVATDDKRILNQFIQKYGNQMCCYNDVFRNDRNKSVIFEKSERNRHKYRLGLEVLRDMYTLAMCDGLVAGISQVAVCAQINKLSTGEKYEDLKIINKGIYRNCREFRRW